MTRADLLSCLRQPRGLLGFEDDDPLAAVAALADTAEHVSYWGSWSAGLLEDPAVIAELGRIAERVAESPGCQWWWSRADRSAQQFVEWDGPEEPAPELGGAAEVLRRLTAEAIKSERRMRRHRHRPAGTGTRGPWWSFPFPGLVSTTRRLGSLGAVLLAGREDGQGETEAVVRPVAIAGDARVFEIDGPGRGSGWSPAIPRRQRPSTGIPGPGRAGTANGWYPAGQRWRPTGTGSTSAWRATFPPPAASCPPVPQQGTSRVEDAVTGRPAMTRGRRGRVMPPAAGRPARSRTAGRPRPAAGAAGAWACPGAAAVRSARPGGSARGRTSRSGRGW